MIAVAIYEHGLKMHGPTRVIFNFATRCNMSCQFCYIPFSPAEPVEERAAHEVLNAISAWPTIRSLTFGGGDPLMFSFTDDLLATAKALWGSELFVQLDTNGLALSAARMQRIAPYIDLLGLPLDAASDDVNLQMRGHARQWRRVPRIAANAVASGSPVKINTVLAAPNAPHIADIARTISTLDVAAWSLYEFWPIGDLAVANETFFGLDETEFERLAGSLVVEFPEINIEIGSRSQRTNAYLFVTPAGRAYATDPSDSSRYVSLGNVLRDSDEVHSNWLDVGDGPKNGARFERRMTY